MKTGTGLAVVAIGAILAFAVTANTSVFNLNTAGWVLMIIGVIGLAIPRRGYAWVGRRLFVRQARWRPRNRVETRSSIRPSSTAIRPTPACGRGLPAPGAVGSQQAPPTSRRPGTCPPIRATSARARPRSWRTSTRNEPVTAANVYS